MELNDLDWADRETILRLLFSKMNAGVQTNTLAARQAMKQAGNREDTMRALSDQNLGDHDAMAREYREKYGQFDNYL